MHHLSLPLILRLDAAACAAMAAALLVAGRPLATLTGLPAAPMTGAGVAFVPCAALMMWAAAAPTRRSWAIRAIVLGNAAWAAASLAVLLPGVTAPNGMGVALVLAQAAAVAALALIEGAALRRAAVGA